ncbi:MAG: hypothetical protein AAF184_23880 [Pseudomonadota bacterium]
MKAFTHTSPGFVFWVSPEGSLIDARDSHLKNPPKGRRDILRDEPDYGGYLRGRVATSIDGIQLVAVYCRPQALSGSAPGVSQLLSGLDELPVPLQSQAMVVSDNGDLYGTVADLRRRETNGHSNWGTSNLEGLS